MTASSDSAYPNNHQTANDNLEHLNADAFEEMRDLLEEDFVPLIMTYMTDSIAKAEQLAAACLASDNSSAFELAHSLKGASSNLGLIHLGQLCAELEQVCRDKNIHNAQTLVDAIAAEVALTNADIQARLTD